MTKLSEHFTLEELIFSETAIRNGVDNSPSKELLDHALKFLIPGLEQVRKLLGFPIKINSGYRSVELNKIVPGSSNTSQHTKFEAADILCPDFGSPLSVCRAIIASNIKFDQIIYEYGRWTHISFNENPRRIITSKWYGRPYEQGLVDNKGKRIQ